MAPPPEYDKEPKAPDKSATTISCEETKALHNLVNDQQTNSDNKSASTPANTEVENNKHVETLDDGQLRALLDEAITYKCPKDREGKSSLFKELLEEVEQDEQACEAAARGACGAAARRVRGAGGGGGARARRALPHSNSLQDLVAALAAEPAPRRHRAPPAPAHPPVSARAIHGGSLPSGVDTSFLLGEEPPRAGYLATVRCVNPPPLAERRVSASDANAGTDLDTYNRRSKPAFPMTYTARATLEIGSGSVSSGRAVTTTTASNQVRTLPVAGPPTRLFHKKLYNHKPPFKRSPKPSECTRETEAKTTNANDIAANISKSKVNAQPRKDKTQVPKDGAVTLPVEEIDSNQYKLLKALLPKTNCDLANNGGGSKASVNKSEVSIGDTGKKELPRGPLQNLHPDIQIKPYHTRKQDTEHKKPLKPSASSEFWINNVNQWYQGLEDYTRRTKTPVLDQEEKSFYESLDQDASVPTPLNSKQIFPKSQIPKCNYSANTSSGSFSQNVAFNKDRYSWTQYYSKSKPDDTPSPIKNSSYLQKPETYNNKKVERNPRGNMFAKRNIVHEKISPWGIGNDSTSISSESSDNNDVSISRHEYRNRIGEGLMLPTISINPRNIRSMTIGESLPNNDINDETSSCDSKSDTDDYKIDNNDNVPSLEGDMHPVTHQDFVDSSLTDTEKSKDALEEVDNKLLPKRDTSLSEAIRSKTPLAEESDRIEDGGAIISIVNDVDAGTSSQTNVSNEQETDNTSTDVQDEKGTVDISVDSKSDYVTINLGEEFKQSFFSYSRDKHQSCEQEKELETLSRSEEKSVELINISKNFRDKKVSFDCEKDVELVDMSFRGPDGEQVTEEDQKVLPMNTNEGYEDTSFASYFASQQKLLQALEDSNLVDSAQEHSLFSFLDNGEKVHSINENKLSECVSEHVDETRIEESHENVPNVNEKLTYEDCSNSVISSGPPDKVVMRLDQSMVGTVSGEVNARADLPNNAYVFLTLPQRLLSHLHNNADTDQLRIEYINDISKLSGESNTKTKKKKDLAFETTKMKKVTINKHALRALLFENLSKSDSADKSQSKELSTVTTREVDSAIPFSCITSPEVVASCNTTSSNAQSAVAVDPKPLQLGWSYRAVASLTGDPPPPPRAHTHTQPRSVINVSSLNGLPLSRPNYGSTGSTTQDEFKKSIDENGNSVQGFSSPLSGSSQHKKPRRKKSSKNETVIKSHQIDGYQGNKDLNEVLRFIESNAETTRAHKLGRAKHKDDADDKGGKKRSTERRKDKESKMKRASSLEELSRTTLEDLTDKPPKKERRGDVAPKQERRSWGDDARPAFYYEPEVAADADFQTVTKKRKPRRRADEAERSPGGAAPAPAPARPRRVSAPPSDRSNDSNDDLDSVHSLPADAPPRPAPPAPASYADIARTRHNIPDLIESCNFYAEGEAGRAAEPPPAAPGDSDGYPALEPRAPRARAPPKPQPHAAHAPPRARDRKERLESVRGAECPAPDVVADRRPPVILLDSSSRPRDMDGVTFGFDINEQLLGGPTRRPRCDLVRDAIEGGTVTIVEANGVTPVVTALPGVPGVGVVPAVAGVTVVPGAGAGVCVVAGCALRYVAPAPPPDTHHLHQIVDYVGAAWEDVMRCGGGKLRYFSE